jgi:hypothetical protein
VAPDTINKLGNNRWEPRPRTILKLAEVLEVHPDELTGYGRED